MFTVRSLTSTTGDINKVMGISEKEEAELKELELTNEQAEQISLLEA